MTDIDFDELDKAVNSVLGPRATDSPIATSGGSTPAADTPTPTQSAPEAEKTGEAPKIILTPRPRQPITSPAAKRSGRFMDMVHPSSDMASEKDKPAPAPRVKIMPTDSGLKAAEPAPEAPEPATKVEQPQAAAHSAILDAVMAPASSAVPAEDEKKVEAAPEAASATSEPLPNMKSDYPDPIDVAGPLSIAEEPPKEAEKPEEVSTPEVPFIPDAKVEKRPLGGFSPDETPEELDLLAADDKEETQLPPESSLPPALQSDVVAVESDALPEAQSIGNLSEGKEAEPDDEKRAAPAAKPVPAAKSAHHDEGAAQSIPQQYRAEPALADEAPRPVFDTDQYHQPLIAAHAGKKSHAWVFILLVTALLAIGGTLGYFAFMSGL